LGDPSGAGTSERPKVVGSGHCAAIGDLRLELMFPFPPVTDLQFLVGKQLDDICLKPFQFHFAFGTTKIDVGSALEHIDKQGIARRHNTDADKLAPLYIHHLLGQIIRLVLVEDFRLTLAFDQGDLLRIYSNNELYECGEIYDETGSLIVF
jgi:hypothetical protein